MAKILPVTGQASSKVSVILDGNTYTIKTRWNTRTSSWYVAVDASDGSPVIGFEKVSERQQILLQNLNGFADGNLFAFPTNSNKDVPLARDNFGVGKAWELTYLTGEEILEQLDGG